MKGTAAATAKAATVCGLLLLCGVAYATRSNGWLALHCIGRSRDTPAPFCGGDPIRSLLQLAAAALLRAPLLVKR